MKRSYLVLLIIAVLAMSFSCKAANNEAAAEQKGNEEVINVSGNYKSIMELQSKLHDIAGNETSPVVFISVEKTVKYNRNGGSPFDYFFGDPRDKGDNEDKGYKQQGFGSGVIFEQKGKEYFILTNDHVITGADKISINIGNKKYEGKVVGSDPEVDIAVVKVETDDKLAIAKMGTSSNLRVGDFVIAIGNPYGLSHTMTFGIISALGRSNLSSGRASLTDFIQTDAAINPGNSGGPLLNIEGEVIGINTMIYSQSGGNVGIGFSIPVDLALNVAEQLITTGKSEHGWLGVYFQELNEDNLKMLEIEGTEHGMLVSRVMKDSPAEKAGIETGDILLELDGKKLIRSGDLTVPIAKSAPGTKVTFKVLRDGKVFTKTIKLGKRSSMKESAVSESDETVESSEIKKYGLKVSEITAPFKNKYGIPPNRSGVIITEVTGGPAAAANLKPGDVIYKINNKKVTNMKEFLKIIKDLEDTAYFFIYRDGSQFIVMM